jgi:hypothetical protein
MAVDLCCGCGLFVVADEQAVACEHCVDVYHLQCQVGTQQSCKQCTAVSVQHLLFHWYMFHSCSFAQSSPLLTAASHVLCVPLTGPG